nr:integrase arm-type DNA-binding domain-containing protein [Burkholderia ubonensis]
MLEVTTSGSKVWRYRYTLHGERQPMVTIGDYPAMTLQEAREKARRYAEIVAKGVSPIADAKKDRGAVKRFNTVQEFGDDWCTTQIAEMSREYAHTIKRALEKDIYPAIGNKPLADVTPGDVPAICDRIKARGAPKMRSPPGTSSNACSNTRLRVSLLRRIRLMLSSRALSPLRIAVRDFSLPTR